MDDESIPPAGRPAAPDPNEDSTRTEVAPGVAAIDEHTGRYPEAEKIWREAGVYAAGGRYKEAEKL